MIDVTPHLREVAGLTSAFRPNRSPMAAARSTEQVNGD